MEKREKNDTEQWNSTGNPKKTYFKNTPKWEVLTSDLGN